MNWVALYIWVFYITWSTLWHMARIRFYFYNGEVPFAVRRRSAVLLLLLCTTFGSFNDLHIFLSRITIRDFRFTNRQTTSMACNWSMKYSYLENSFVGEKFTWINDPVCLESGDEKIRHNHSAVKHKLNIKRRPVQLVASKLLLSTLNWQARRQRLIESTSAELSHTNADHTLFIRIRSHGFPHSQANAHNWEMTLTFLMLLSFFEYSPNRETTLAVYAFSMIGMWIYTFTLNAGHIAIVYITSALLG